MYTLSCYIWLKNVDRPVSVTITEDTSGNRFETYEDASSYRDNLLSTIKNAFKMNSGDAFHMYRMIDSLVVNLGEVSCIYADIKRKS